MGVVKTKGRLVVVVVVVSVAAAAAATIAAWSASLTFTRSGVLKRIVGISWNELSLSAPSSSSVGPALNCACMRDGEVTASSEAAAVVVVVDEEDVVGSVISIGLGVVVSVFFSNCRMMLRNCEFECCLGKSEEAEDERPPKLEA